jgi:hypothetical protein
MMNDPDFDTRILYKTIAPKTIKQEISYYLDGDRINTDPDIVKEKVFEHYDSQFSKATDPKDINFFLNQIKQPTNPKVIEPKWTEANVRMTLISKANTAPGPDQIPKLLSIQQYTR